jgi:hypothetical protein
VHTTKIIHFEFLIKINSEFLDYTLRSIIDTGIWNECNKNTRHSCINSYSNCSNSHNNYTTSSSSTVHYPLIKHGSNSYAISSGSSTVGSFDTTYTIAGERSAIRSAENLIISTITNDFRTSPTIGYVRAGGRAQQLAQMLLFLAHLQAMSR